MSEATVSGMKSKAAWNKALRASPSCRSLVGRLLALRTRLGLTLLASRMLHRKAEMSPGRSLEKSWRRWTAARFGVSVWGRAQRRASPRAGPWRSGSRVVRRFARAQWSWMRAKFSSVRELRENWSHRGLLEQSKALPGRTCRGVRHQGGRRRPRCV